MTARDTGDLWWKNSVVYCLNVERYMDWNNDGVGDFEGLAHRIDYLADLGVTCLWLMPFYPSPRRDDGYDVSDYYGVNEGFGDLGDFVDVVRTAKDRGIRLVVDLVANHTSEKHPWFRSARASESSRYRDYYVWADEPDHDDVDNMFPDVEDSVWTFDERAGQYYRHAFYAQQPDLNTENPSVAAEIAKVMGFWLALGVDGFRVDSVPHVINDGSGRHHPLLRSLRQSMSRRTGSAILLGEVNLPYDEQVEFFGGDNGDELTMQFDFVANQRMYLSLARQDARPLADTLTDRPAIAEENQWANFVRNHDELTLDQLSAAERDEVFTAFAPEEHHRIHGRGITRRLPSMLEGDPRRIRMVYSLLFSLPGVPVLYYGEEIGMAENPEIGGRRAVRTPMQWSAERHGGFSRANRRRLITPLTDGAYGPDHVNVSDQRHDPDSLLRFVSSLATWYRNSPEIGWGDFEVLDQPHPSVLAHSLRLSAGQLVALHNLSPEAKAVPLQIDDTEDSTRLIDLLDRRQCSPDASGRVELTLEGYGYRWIRVLRAGDRRLS